MNDAIQNYEIKIQDGEEEIKSLQGELVMENQCLVDEELSLKWFINREESLQQKLLELDEPKKAKEMEMVSFSETNCGSAHGLGILLMNSNCFAIHFQRHIFFMSVRV